MSLKFIVLLLLAFAAVTFASLPLKNAHGAKPRAGSTILKSRQMSRAKMLEIAERERLIKKGVLRPRASAKLYPKCTAPTAPGFARYPNYEYVGSTIENVAAGSEGACMDLCLLDSRCIGVFYQPGVSLGCSKKNTANQNSALVQTTASATSGAVTTMKGSCSDLEAIYGSTKSIDCCDTVAKYPLCTYSTLIGYARLPQWNYALADVPGNPFMESSEADCLIRCNNAGSACAGIFWAPDKFCYLKSTNNQNYNWLNNDEASLIKGSGTSFKTSCNVIETFGTPPQVISSCCNTIN